MGWKGHVGTPRVARLTRLVPQRVAASRYDTSSLQQTVRSPNACGVGCIPQPADRRSVGDEGDARFGELVRGLLTGLRFHGCRSGHGLLVFLRRVFVLGPDSLGERDQQQQMTPTKNQPIYNPFVDYEGIRKNL